MFSFFRHRRSGNTVIASDEDDFLRRFDRMVTPRRVFDAQGDTHSEIDMRLVERIEGLLVPLLGQWEQSDRWFHQIDVYGNGVRSLVFRRDIFPTEQVGALQALLTGEHEPFTVLCSVTDQMSSDDQLQTESTPDDYLGIFARSLLVTKPLANKLLQVT